jgi:uncharacterized membrane protein YuzA (DUF378 family)
MHKISWILLIVGGLNWGLVGLGSLMNGSWNVVNMLLGRWPMVEAIVYLLVGVAAVYELVSHKKNCKCCDMKGGSQM